MSAPEPFSEYIARLRAGRDAFVAEVERSVTETGAYVAPIRHGGWITLTRSTRAGIAWQVTFWEGNPEGDPEAQPTGHLDIRGGIADAAREMVGLVRR